MISVFFLFIGFLAGASFAVIDHIGYAAYMMMCNLESENADLKERVEELEEQLKVLKDGSKSS